MPSDDNEILLTFIEVQVLVLLSQVAQWSKHNVDNIPATIVKKLEKYNTLFRVVEAYKTFP